MVRPFVDIAATVFDSSFNSISTSVCFVSFEVIILVNFFSLSSKSVYFTRLAISFLFVKLTYVNLATKLSDFNLLNSGVLITFLWSGILFLTEVRTVPVAKLVILGILLIVSIVFALRVVLVGTLVISGVLSSIFLILALF